MAQYGFGPGFDDQRSWLAAGWAAIVADLVVLFERGVVVGRHLLPWAGIGADVVELPGGLTVSAVRPGGLADQCGVEVGDLLVAVAGSPVTTIRDLSVLVRGPVSAGSTAELRYLRDTSVLSGTGTV